MTMEEIFKKLENAKVDILALIADDDKQYCLDLFDKYTAHVKFIQDLLQTTVEAWDNHQVLYEISSNGFYYELYKMDKQLETYQEMLTALHKKVVDHIERYFKSKYNIEFVSYSESQKPAEVIIHENLNLLIEHMLQQVGSDLIESGKKQVVERFQKLFSYPRQQPEIKNNKISFPIFYSLGYGSPLNLSMEDKNIHALLHAISLIIYDTPVITEEFHLQYKEWKNEIEYNKVYLLQADISIKFFKNRRVDVSLPSTYTAEKFWQLYQLESIILSNNID